MKIRLTRKAKELASALMVSLVITSILSLFVMYYLSLIEQQNILNARSQTWNMAIAISEAGVEEGLQQLNSAYPNMASDGWTYDGSGCYSKSNSFADGSAYSAYIFMTNGTTPTVVARAYVTPPNATYWQTTAMILFAAQGQTAEAGKPVTRAVQVICNKTSPFSGALIAKKNIDLNGNNITTDSFDSSSSAKSTNGQRDPAKYLGDKGDIATNLGIINSIMGGNANVFGHAHTGPGSPDAAVQVGSTGFIGSHADYATGMRGIDPGWWLDDANFTFPDTTYPDTSSYLTPTNGWVTNMNAVVSSNWTTMSGYIPPTPLPSVITTNSTYVPNQTVAPAPGTYTSYSTHRDHGTTYYDVYQITGFNYASSYTTNFVPVGTYYDHILWGSGGVTNSYVASDLSGTTYVTGPNVILALPNGLNMGSSDAFTVGTGANVTIYSGGTSCTIGGQGFLNTAGFAGDLLLFCAPTVTTLAYNGNSAFMGVLVAPSVDINLNGSGSNVAVDFTGSLLANSVTLNGHFNFHYDESLAGLPGYGRFLILSWNEIK